MLKVGFSRVDMTPPLGSHLAGYYQDRIAKGIRDPLYLNSIAFSDGEETIVWVTADVLNIRKMNANEIRGVISKRVDLPVKNIFVSALHQHTSIIIGSKEGEASIYSNYPYMAHLYSKFADVAQMAIADMKEAKMSAGEKETAEELSFVRRYLMKDGTIRTNPGRGTHEQVVRPLDDADNTVRVFRFTREDGDIALVNFSTHPDVIGGELYSADWPGFVRSYVEADIKDTRCIFINGVEGDTNHLDFRIADLKHGYAHSKHMGRVITDTVLELWNDLEEIEVEHIKSATDLVYSRTRMDGFEDYDKSRAYLADYHAGKCKDDPDALDKMIVASRIASLRDTGIFQVLPMSAINFGKVAIVGFGGEAFTHYGTSIRQACPEMKYMLTTCCTNGGEGYLPTASAFAEGGYEEIRTIFSPTLEAECTAMARKLVDETKV
ncbi:MAG: hypothetical protein J6V42_06735 [Clostridia bacterium]|nr:hypothetical protein [Clostridia bacterium]